MFDQDDSRADFLKILAEMGEEPAFLIRGIAAENALDVLLERCAVHYDEQLEWPRRHFTALRRRIAGEWSRLQSLLEQQEHIELFSKLEDQLRTVKYANSISFLANHRRGLKQLIDSATRFNIKWLAFTDGDGLKHVNEMRGNYNRFYPIEKACAFGNDRVNEGFRPLQPLTASFLLKRFPLLELPELK